MATYYVDLGATSDGDGSTGAPYTEAQVLAIGVFSEDKTFKIKGSSPTLALNFSIDVFDCVVEAWDSSMPPTIAFTAPGYANGMFTVNGIIFSGLYNEISLSTGSRVTCTNCLFINSHISSVPKDAQHPPLPLTVLGCTFYTDIAHSWAIYSNCNAGIIQAVSVDSCYFDGPFTSIVYVNNLSNKGGWVNQTVTIGYCAVYNNPGFTTLVTLAPNANTPITDLLNHKLYPTSPSQIAYPFDHLPGDLVPAVGSYLINAGDPALGVATDIFGTSRAPRPTIGCAEEASVSFLKLYDIVIQPSTTKAGRLAGIRQNIYDTCVLNSGNILTNKEDIKKVWFNFKYFGNALLKAPILADVKLTPNALEGICSFNSKAPLGTWQLETCVVQSWDHGTMTLTRADFGDLSDFVLIA